MPNTQRTRSENLEETTKFDRSYGLLRVGVAYLSGKHHV